MGIKIKNNKIGGNIIFAEKDCECSNLIVINGEIYVNGKKIILDKSSEINNFESITIEITGDVNEINVDCGDVRVNGNVNTLTLTNGDVECRDVSGNVKTTNGDIRANTIKGSANTVNGDILRK